MHWSIGKYTNSSSSDRLTFNLLRKCLPSTNSEQPQFAYQLSLQAQMGSGKSASSAGISNHQGCFLKTTLHFGVKQELSVSISHTVPLNNTKEISTQESRFTEINLHYSIRKLWNETAWQWRAHEADAAASSAKTSAVLPALTLHHRHKHHRVQRANSDLG